MVGNSSVTVNSGSGGRQVVVSPLSSVGHPPSSPINQRQVLATPLCVQRPVGTPLPTGQRSVGKLDKLILKEVCKSTKKDSRNFTLRNLNTTEVCSCDDLKKVIRSQLHQDITSKDFDIGYVQGSNVIRIRSREDLSEMWIDLRNPKSKMTLWCDGLKESSSKAARQTLCETESDDEESMPKSKKKRRQPRNDEEVQEIVERLKKKHGSNFTPMQFRIWGEMVFGGLHMNTDELPNTNYVY